jgi:selenide,water dikinase
MVLAAAKRGLVDASDYDIAVHQMIELNRVGSALGRLSGVAAMTDITGFGLLGHLLEMTDSGRLTAIVDFAEVPQMKSNAKWIAGAVYPDMTMKNYSVFAAHTSVLSMEQLLVLCDPQTSGGLMVAVSPSSLDAYLAVIRDFGLQGIADRCIGRFVEASEKRVEVR